MKTRLKPIEDLDKVRLGGFAPTIAPQTDLNKIRKAETADAGVCKMGGGAIYF